MFHVVDGDIGYQSYGIIIIGQGYFHVLLIDFHVVGNDLDNIIFLVVHDFRGNIGPVMNEHDFQTVMGNFS